MSFKKLLIGHYKDAYNAPDEIIKKLEQLLESPNIKYVWCGHTDIHFLKSGDEFLQLILNKSPEDYGISFTHNALVLVDRIKMNIIVQQKYLYIPNPSSVSIINNMFQTILKYFYKIKNEFGIYTNIKLDYNLVKINLNGLEYTFPIEIPFSRFYLNHNGKRFDFALEMEKPFTGEVLFSCINSIILWVSEGGNNAN